MSNLASLIGTSLSNLYEIIKDGLIATLDYDLSERVEFSSNAAWNKRTKKSLESNSSKCVTSKFFINLILKEFRNSYNINSIDEIIGDFKKTDKNEIQDMPTICTAIFYNYVAHNKIENFSFDELPSKRKRKNEKYLGKQNLGINQMKIVHLILMIALNLVTKKVILLLEVIPPLIAVPF